MAQLYKRPKIIKIKSQISLEALRMAKANNDPLYKKYKKFRNLYLKYRSKILQKYSGKAKTKVYGSM